MNTLPPISHPDSQVHALDRLAFTLLMAVVVHFLIWAALDLNWPQPDLKTETNHSLRVTLVKVKADTLDEQAQHIAEQNQAASGLGEQDLEPQTASQAAKPAEVQAPDATPIPTPVAAKAQATSEAMPKASAQAHSQPTRATSTPALTQAPKTETVPPSEAQVQNQTAETAAALPNIDATALVARSLEIARLEAEQQALAQQYAKRPKVRTLSTVSAKAYDDAAYLRQWQEQIERVGNLNYPEKVRAQKLSGRLRMLVALNADGSIKEIQLLKSSGFELLDQSAINIVKLAAPFAAFPRSIKERTDILEIIRTWQFGDGNLFGDAG